MSQQITEKSRISVSTSVVVFALISVGGVLWKMDRESLVNQLRDEQRRALTVYAEREWVKEQLQSAVAAPIAQINAKMSIILEKSRR